MAETPALNCSMVLSNNHSLFDGPSLRQYICPPRYNWNIVERVALNTITPLPPFSIFHMAVIFLVMFCFYLVVFSAIFNNISVTKYIVAVSFIGGGNRSTRRKPPTCRNITDKLYHIMLYQCTSPSAGLLFSCDASCFLITNIMIEIYSFFVY